jgi:hypothetical protein
MMELALLAAGGATTGAARVVDVIVVDISDAAMTIPRNAFIFVS